MERKPAGLRSLNSSYLLCDTFVVSRVMTINQYTIKISHLHKSMQKGQIVLCNYPGKFKLSSHIFIKLLLIAIKVSTSN